LGFLKLIQLVSAINNNGHPTLCLPSAKKIKMTPQDKVMFAITTLLVWNHKVVAVAASGIGILTVLQPINSEPDSANNEV